jgi:hypothetical protein
MHDREATPLGIAKNLGSVPVYHTGTDPRFLAILEHCIHDEYARLAPLQKMSDQTIGHAWPE